MPDYEHSSNFHKVSSKIKEINNLKDLDALKKKLGELEQDDEVHELIAKCDERAEEIKGLIKEDKYQKAVSGFDIEGDNLESQISSFQEIKGYKDSSKYLHSLNTEREYRSLVKSFDSGNCNWEKVSFGFKALGEYKKAREYFQSCQLKAEEQKKEKELKEKRDREEKLKKDYQEALGYMEKGSFGYAALKFADLGDYQDSKQKAEECKKMQEENELLQKRAKKKQDRIIIITIISLIIIGIGIYLGVALTHWTVDESGHWHQLLSSRSSYSEHEFVLVEEALPTCKLNGRKQFQCSVCGYLWEETIKALGHDSDDGVTTKEPTCTESGERIFHCKTCGAVIRTVTLPKTEHSYNVITTLEPSCLSRGLAVYTCSVCGYSENRPIDSLGHDWKEKKRTEPTCTNEGLITYECSRCGKEYSENISATGHNWVAVKEVAPTCVSDGYVEYNCSVCNITRKEVIDAKGHNYFDGFCLDCGFDRNQYHVGDIGPAGGYVFYDCDADNAFGNKDGLKSSKCGWRFLEAAPADLRVVDGTPTVDTKLKGYYSETAYKTIVFGYYATSDTNLYVNGTTSYKASDCTKSTIGTGKVNTLLLVGAMGDETYSYYKGSDKTANYAARLCDILTHTVNGVKYDDWFLPSKDELNLMYLNLAKDGWGGFADNYYWSSSEGSTNVEAWYQSFANGGQHSYRRYYDLRVRPVRAF